MLAWTKVPVHGSRERLKWNSIWDDLGVAGAGKVVEDATCRTSSQGLGCVEIGE